MYKFVCLCRKIFQFSLVYGFKYQPKKQFLIQHLRHSSDSQKTKTGFQFIEILRALFEGSVQIGIPKNDSHFSLKLTACVIDHACNTKVAYMPGILALPSTRASRLAWNGAHVRTPRPHRRPGAAWTYTTARSMPCMAHDMLMHALTCMHTQRQCSTVNVNKNLTLYLEVL